MPIYEFYCPECHTIFSFLSRTINTEKKPPCPRCHKEILSRKVSLFAALTGASKQKDDEGGDLPIDESKMESAMTALASEAESISEDDPRAAARLMRKFSNMAGLKYNDSMEEALSRMESGEDPEAIEQEMGELLEGEDEPFVLPGVAKGAKGVLPRRDDTLYEM
jgi:putative FmdB family regulatory protein